MMVRRLSVSVAVSGPVIREAAAPTVGAYTVAVLTMNAGRTVAAPPTTLGANTTALEPMNAGATVSPAVPAVIVGA